MLTVKHDVKVLQRRVFRPQSATGGGVFGGHRKQDHVVDGQQRPNRQWNADQQQLGFGGNFFQAHLDSLFIMKYTKGKTKGSATTMEAIAKSTWSKRK